jgi:hypothetical protein
MVIENYIELCFLDPTLTNQTEQIDFHAYL